MIVWGGWPGKSSGGRYCVSSCTSPGNWYQDQDGDGYGITSVLVPACTQPPGYAANFDDCDDANPTVHPGMAEACNGVDDDCDTVVDDGADASCNDGNPCTADSCHAASRCLNLPTPAAMCDDGNACTTGDRCDGRGACVGGALLDCSDQNPCTADACSPATGCSHGPAACFNVDFAPAASPVAAGFVKDDGSVFSPARGFGWSVAVETRARSSANPLELNTFAFSQPQRTWTAELPTGDYEVCLVAGDPSYAQGPHRITANGVTLIGDVVTQANQFASSCSPSGPSHRIPVRNGRLQVGIGGTAGNTLINYVKTGPAPGTVPNSWSVNFQPAASSAPAGIPRGQRPDVRPRSGIRLGCGGDEPGAGHAVAAGSRHARVQLGDSHLGARGSRRRL